jgi:hypothetical protein
VTLIIKRISGVNFGEHGDDYEWDKINYSISLPNAYV